MTIILSRKPGGSGGSGAPSGPAGGDLTGTYPNPTLAANSVDSAEIAADAVGASELADNAVDTNAIQNGAVTAGKLATGLRVLTELFDSVLGADAASFDTGAGGFSTALDHLLIYAYLRTTQAIVQSTATLTFNNDGTGNYDSQRISVTNATVSGGILLAQTSLGFNVLGGNAQAGAFSGVEIEVPHYAGTVGHKAVLLRNMAVEDTAADCVSETKWGRWRNTAAISRIIVTAGSGNFLAGSRLTVYGIG